MGEGISRVGIVTGGSRGIGKAIVLDLAKDGMTVISIYRANEKAADETVQLAVGLPGKVIPVKGDIADQDNVKRIFKEIVRRHGRVDVLVNNAGIARDNLIALMKAEEWEDVIRTNLFGVFYCCQAVSRQMIKQRFGRIVNISSVVGVTGNAGQCNYSSAKAGIIGFTRSLAKELASRNITVNAVAPGFIETDMTSKLPEKARSAMIEQIPLGRAGNPQDIASLVKFLVSDAASYITGQVIHVNGGMFMG